MEVIEFGKENALTVILLHGGGLSWWNYKDVAEILSSRYHVVIPFLNGHAYSESDFTTIEDTAIEICEYIQNKFGGKVFAIGGLSLGGQILVEMLSSNPDICEFAIIESTLVIPMRLTNLLISPMISVSYRLIKKLWFAKLQFKQLHIKTDLFDSYYNDTCKIKKENLIAFLKSNSSYHLKSSISTSNAKVVIAVGEKEGYKMKKSAMLLHQKLPKSKLEILPKYYHGDLSINNAEKYVELFESLVKA